jgi:hypothetical protein
LADASGEGRGRKIRIMEENERQQEERGGGRVATDLMENINPSLP